MKLNCLTALSLLGLAAAVAAQTPTHSIIASPDASFRLKNSVGPKAMGLIDDQESLIVTPELNKSYSARPFATFTGMNVMHGDGDGDGDLNDISIYGDLNGMMVRNRPPHQVKGPVNPGSIFISVSFNTTGMVATTTGIVQVKDGDYFRCRHGKVEFFVKEAMMAGALGDAAGDIDLDGMAQDAAGNLYFSLWASVTLGTTAYADGDLFYIPAKDITYDTNGMVTAITVGAAKRIATETDVDAMVVASKALGQDGTALQVVGDTAAVNVDPNGGTWKSPQDPTLTLPNLVFTSNFTPPFDTLWSTANGGSVAKINGVTMGYLTGKADGRVLGVTPEQSQDGTNAMVIVPAQEGWIAIDSPQSGGSVQGVFDIEVGALQPFTSTVLIFSLWAGDKVGGFVPGVPLPTGLYLGNGFFEATAPVITVVGRADANGYASLSIADPMNVPAGVDILVQGVGFAPGQTKLSVTQTSNITF